MKIPEIIVESIRVSPDTDEPRLHYAQQLRASGELDKALFIESQCQLFHLLPYGVSRQVLAKTSEQLQTRYKELWCDELGLPSTEVTFERGFPSHWLCHAKQFLASSEEILRYTPIDKLTLFGDAKDISQCILSCPPMRFIRSLTVQNAEPEFEQVVTALAQTELLLNLRELCLSHCGMKGPHLAILARSPQSLKNVQQLGLPYNFIEWSDLLVLGEFISHCGLRNLDLSNNRLYETGVAAFTTSTDFSSLQQLDLSYNYLSSYGASALAQATNLHSLVDLRLANTKIGEGGFVDLVDSELASQLQSLDVGRSNILGLYTMFTDRHRKLKRLNLSNNAFGEEGACEFSILEELGGLEVLRLENCNLNGRTIQHLVQWPSIASLQELYLAHNTITPAGAKALAQSKYLHSLQYLDLSNNNIGNQGALTLAEATNFLNLQGLNLEYNTIGKRATTALKKSKAFPSLGELRVD